MLTFKRYSLTQGEKNPIFKRPHFLSTRSEKRCPPTCNNITAYKNNQTTEKETEHFRGVIQKICSVVTYDTEGKNSGENYVYSYKS